MNITLTCPSKTFIVGEYLALTGGPTLVLNTQPRFQLDIQKTKPKLIGIHEHSPAGLFIANNSDLLNNYAFNFLDPHKKLGGFGASTAQFLLVSYFKYWLVQGEPQKMNVLHNYLLKNYYHCAWDGKGMAPSGADLIGQLHGKITYFHKKAQTHEILDWPFTELSLFLVRTGHKVATHDHLHTLTTFPTNKLTQYVEQAVKGLKTADPELFSSAINKYGELLAGENLVISNTLSILRALNETGKITGLKGCGALGADVILVLCHKNETQNVREILTQLQLPIVATEADITNGLTLEKANTL